MNLIRYTFGQYDISLGIGEYFLIDHNVSDTDAADICRGTYEKCLTECAKRSAEAAAYKEHR